eukprot:gb/GECG01006953.1/.p1 GENE.gb/GECG01006953.1/~~gb/GECG01006953.1/.p1  ORF type:complete len:502 (+),score=52.23 gb/GECG01006953.1/:1-1506(+)
MQALRRTHGFLGRATMARFQSTQPAAAATTYSKPSWLESLVFDLPDQNPLDEAFPGVPAPQGRTAYVGVGPEKVQQSKLANGVQIGSVDAGGPYASLRFHVKSGTRVETTPGTAFVLKNLAFKATQRRSEMKLYRDVELTGGAFGATSQREVLNYHSGALRDNIDSMVEGLAETIIQPRLAHWEITEMIPQLNQQIDAFNSDPQNVLLDQLHAAAFLYNAESGYSGLGHPLMPSPEQAANVTIEDIKEFMGHHFKAGNIAITGNNIDHSRLVDLSDMYFLSIPEGSSKKPASSKCSGGESVIRKDTGVADLAVCLEAPSLQSKDLHVAGVLQALLGEQSPRRFDRHTRVAELMRDSAKAKDIKSMQSFIFPYSDSGLIGLMAKAPADSTYSTVETMANLLKELASSTPTADEVNRAKKAYRLNYVNSLDSSGGPADVIGHHLLSWGSYQDPQPVLQAIDKITPEDVTRVASEILKTEPSMAAITSTSARVPRFDKFAGFFK